MGRRVLPFDGTPPNRIRELREACGINQPELARRIGHSKSYLSRLERGEIDSPNLAILTKIARELDVEISDLGFQPRVGTQRQSNRSGITVIIVNLFLGRDKEQS